jgi:NADH-quinone oxidoreductase subunit E
MSSPSTNVQQPESFAFSAKNEKAAKEIISRYPEGRQASAIMPLFDLAQRQSGGWLPLVAIENITARLEVPVIRGLEVATFYTMYNMEPVGKYLVQICTTTPCWLRGSDDVVSACKKNLGIDLNETTADGEFTLREVECLGACVNAPVVQIGNEYFEDVDAESAAKILDALRAGKKPKPGSQTGRSTSAPAGPLTSLTEVE